MTYAVEYTGRASEVAIGDIGTIAQSFADWLVGNPDATIRSFRYDNEQSEFQITFVVGGYASADTGVSDIDSRVSTINANVGTDFGMASESAAIAPE
jgi:hypothetical protein